MKFLRDLLLDIEIKLEVLKYKYQIRQYKKLYPDYEDDEYNCGELKHIWGIKSWDDLTKADACLYTMNDIDITYDREQKLYYLGIETAYVFKDKESSECHYLKELLNAFTKFMQDNDYSTESNFSLHFGSTNTSTSAKSIEELYTNFRIFVEGYCKIYE